MWLTVLVLIILHFFHPKTEFLCIGRVFDYAIWFYSGLMISKTDLVEKILKIHTWLAMVAGMAIYVLGTFSDAFITTIGGIVLSFGLALLLDTYLPKTFFTFRNYTYQIFLMGIFAQIMVKMVFRYVDFPYIPSYILCILAGLYVPVLISKLLERLNWKPLLLCVGLKKKV